MHLVNDNMDRYGNYYIVVMITIDRYGEWYQSLWRWYIWMNAVVM